MLALISQREGWYWNFTEREREREREREKIIIGGYFVNVFFFWIKKKKYIYIYIYIHTHKDHTNIHNFFNSAKVVNVSMIFVSLHLFLKSNKRIYPNFS